MTLHVVLVVLAVVSAYAALVTLAVVAQRQVLRQQRRAIQTFRSELQQASELMAVMARQDVAEKPQGRAKAAR